MKLEQSTVTKCTNLKIEKDEEVSYFPHEKNNLRDLTRPHSLLDENPSDLTSVPPHMSQDYFMTSSYPKPVFFVLHFSIRMCMCACVSEREVDGRQTGRERETYRHTERENKMRII